jgi:hypothetical protein
MWETRGSRTRGEVRLAGPFLGEGAKVARVNGLEEPEGEILACRESGAGSADLPSVEPFGDSYLEMEMRPFEITTLRLSPES